MEEEKQLQTEELAALENLIPEDLDQETEEPPEYLSAISEEETEQLYIEEPEAPIEEDPEAVDIEGEESLGLPEEEVEDASAEDEKPHELSQEDKIIAERIRLRKIETDKKKRRTKIKIISSVTLVILALTAFILSFTSIFTVDSIEVRGNSHYTADEVISIAHAVPGKNLIYHSDKGSIQKYLESNPYIKSAEVSRKFPSTLVITVAERTPTMALKYDDDYLVLDSEGILLQKSPSKPKLTVIEGHVIKRIKLGQPLGTKDEDLMSKTVDLLNATRENDLYFVKVDITDKYNVKAYVYDTLIVKNDYETLIENIKNGKLHMVLDKLFSDSIKRGSITFNEDGTSTFMPGF